MPLELRRIIPSHIDRRKIIAGDRGFLIHAKSRGSRSPADEGAKKLLEVAEYYLKEKFPEPEPADIDDDAEESESATEGENGVKKEVVPSIKVSSLVFHPFDMYDNCAFFLTNLPDPSDFAHFFFSHAADSPQWSRPRFCLRIQPVQVVCRLKPSLIEKAVFPVLEEVFGGDEALRFSFNVNVVRPNPDMTLRQVEALIRNCIWSLNPNCVQCLKYQDFGIMLEIIDNLLFMGVAKDYNQLGQYNTGILGEAGRDLRHQLPDSEDDISDDPNLTEEGNVKRKLKIKRKRRLERRLEEAARLKKQKEENDAEMKEENEESMEDMNGKEDE